LLSLLDPVNYSFSGPKLTPFHPISVTPILTGSAPTDPVTIVLVMSGKSKSHQSVHQLIIRASQISNRAGTTLQAQSTSNETFRLIQPPSVSSKTSTHHSSASRR